MKAAVIVQARTAESGDAQVLFVYGFRCMVEEGCHDADSDVPQRHSTILPLGSAL
jgi:hypothetical protein